MHPLAQTRSLRSFRAARCHERPPGAATRTTILVAVATALGSWVTSARAWDAGPERCKYSECSGGVQPAQTEVLVTRPEFAASSRPIIDRAADCPPGYTNNGLTCGRGAQSFGAASLVASCPDGYTNTGLTCYRGPDSYTKGCTTVFKSYGCADGYTDTGCICQRWADSKSTSAMTCPSGYFLNQALGRCYEQCPSGYTNTGESCYSGPSTLPASSMSCASGGQLVGVRCYECSSSTELYAGLCYARCPADLERTALSTCKLRNNWRGNTHQWIVNRALEMLTEEETDPVASTAVTKMLAPSCRIRWQRGLWDADDGVLVDNPLTAAGGSHFYDASQKDVWGNDTDIVTYDLNGIEVGFNADGSRNPNARQAADARLSGVSAQFSDEDCYQLGIALHYLTDSTQPMHTTGFSAASMPTMLHVAWETYVPAIQQQFPADSPWDQRWQSDDPDQVFEQTALQSATFSRDLMNALVPSSGDTCSIIPVTGALYTGYCFPGDPNVIRETGRILRDAYQSTASYIYSVFRTRQQ